jgi:hypothetical protein
MQKTKNLSVVTKKVMKFRHARTHAKFSSSKTRRKKLCIDKSFELLRIKLNLKIIETFIWQCVFVTLLVFINLVIKAESELPVIMAAILQGKLQLWGLMFSKDKSLHMQQQENSNRVLFAFELNKINNIECSI